MSCTVGKGLVKPSTTCATSSSQRLQPRPVSTWPDFLPRKMLQSYIPFAHTTRCSAAVAGLLKESARMGMGCYSPRPFPKGDVEGSSPLKPAEHDFLQLQEGMQKCLQLQESRFEVFNCLRNLQWPVLRKPP